MTEPLPAWELLTTGMPWDTALASALSSSL